MKTPLKAWCANGFSLVEAVLALAVVSFAMMGIVGLVPVGLSHFKKAITISAESQILRSLSNEIEVTEFSNLLSEYSSPKTLFYDDEGRLIDTAGTYAVTIQIKAVPIPGSSAQSYSAVIEIAPSFDKNLKRRYSIFLPRATSAR